MAKAKRKTLPRDFNERLKAADLDSLKAIFDSVDVDARDGVYKQSALAFEACSDALSRWLVAQGADVNLEDRYGQTPLHARAGRGGDVAVLLALGAEVNHGAGGPGTPLHRAAAAGDVAAARLLLDHGADPDARDAQGQLPLAFALAQCRNIDIESMAAMAELLLGAMSARPARASLLGRLFGTAASPVVTAEMRASVSRIGADFEFHRAGFDPDSVGRVSAALDRLYDLFDVAPVPRRAMHDRRSDIVATGATWQDRHRELWEALVPSSGPARTVQGEVIRISGRIDDECTRNGGINWDAEYRKMADALLAHLRSGRALPPAEIAAAADSVAAIKAGRGDTDELCRYAVDWVARNPRPVELDPPAYHR